MLSNAQKKNYAFFKANINDYLNDPLKAGKYAVISDETLQGTFDTFETAAKFAYGGRFDGFIVQRIIDERRIVNYLHTAVV
jgi:hypothetical protein